MTRKDYRAIAAVISRIPDCKPKAELVEELETIFWKDNIRFSSVKFKEACYARDMG